MFLDLNDPLAVAYVDLNTMRATLNNGESIPITDLFDEDGDECDPEDAVFIVAEQADGRLCGIEPRRVGRTAPETLR